MLDVNIWDLLWTVVNFFVLYFVLNKLLYKPVVAFMDERQSRINAALSRERKAQESFMADKTMMDEERALCRKEAQRILEEAKGESEAKQTELAKQLRQDESRSRREMREKLELLRSEERESFAACEDELTELLVSRLLCGEAEQRS